MSVTVQAKIDPTELGHSLTTEEAHEFIKEIDLAKADTEFTQEVITRLVVSLLTDMGAKDIRQFLKELRKKIK